MRPVRLLPIIATAALIGHGSAAQAQALRTELAGNPLSSYPFFEYVRAFNSNAPVHVAIDPSRFAAVAGETCDIYVANTKSAAQWGADPSLTDVTSGGAQTETFSAGTIQSNTFQVAVANELSADAGTGLGVGYDVVLDCDQNGVLSNADFIDGLGEVAGLYAVHDTAAAGPLAVTSTSYNLAAAVGAGFGIPATMLSEELFYPTNIGSMGQLPMIIISHGNGHNFDWYDHIGEHMASYGYIVVSHANNTAPGPQSAATTTLGHTDAFIDQVMAGTIAGGALAGHLDNSRITWIGHSRGAEGVAIAYDRLFDGTHTPTHFQRSGIRLISSMLPTDFEGTDSANPHDANYHLWTASGDDDVNGSAGNECSGFELCQTFHLHDRATGYRQSTVVQGTGHTWFHDGPETPDWFTGPCSIGPTNTLTHQIQLGYFLPLIKHYVEDNVPALDFLTRQYESFQPIGMPNGNSCIVVTHEYRNGAAVGNFVLDDFQTQTNSGISSSGAQVMFDVENLSEGRFDDASQDFVWNASDPFNGATQAGLSDSLTTRNDDSRGVVFDWTDQDRFIEWEVPTGRRDFTAHTFVSFRGAQGTRHPNTLAVPGDLTFSVTLRDLTGITSTINIGAYGGGLEQPYARSGGWHNEMETVRLRLTDFLNNGSGLDLQNIFAVRVDVGPSFGSSRGRIVVDDLMLTNDRLQDAPPIPVLRVSEAVLDYREVELGFAFTKALVLHNDGNANLSVSVALDPTSPPADVMQWSQLNTSPTVTIAPGDPPLTLLQMYEPQALGTHTIHMTVTSSDPAAPSVPITLTGTGTDPVPIDTMLVIDRSGSMSDPAGDRIKIEALRDAAMLYTDLMRPDIGGTGTGDRLGFWKYNQSNSQYLALDFIDQTDKDNIAASELSNAALTDPNRLQPTGATGIGGAMQNGAGAIGGPLPDREQVLVVLTDGIENVSPYIANVLPGIEAANPDLQLYSVGLGSNIEAGKLQSITNMGTEGYHQVADALTGESLFDLENFYFKIFANAAGMDLVVDPTHVVNLLSPGPILVDSAHVISSDRRADFLVLDDPVLRRFYDLEFVTPSGDVIVPGVTVGGIPIQQMQRNNYRIYRVIFPDVSQASSYVGNWILRLKPNGRWSRGAVKEALVESRFRYSSFIDPNRALVPIGFTAAVKSNYELDVAVTTPTYLPGAELRLHAELTDRGWPAPSGHVNVTVDAPGGQSQQVTLYDDGTHSDVTAGDGIFTNRFVDTAVDGVYRLLFRSVGENARGELAPREASRFVTLAQVEPTPSDDGHGGEGAAGGAVASYLIGTYELRIARTTLHVINPTAKDLELVITFFDENGKPQRCLEEKLTANDLLALDVAEAEPGFARGVVKVVAFEPGTRRPAIGIVGNQRLIYPEGGVSETQLHPIPQKILEEDLKVILALCR
ncbi:vWA domain-containing protein [Allomesorhizobium camelthorni]|uniref:VWA domain-containing protein n=1 Tax=Allomesorhizobium camelthorni TaxID=475069 RepID=A0A6G4WKE1_9HYPH|nr:vWA domain-containing protein [Mesorhizobium camelthorni]NGO54686.1 VWA domain-containing protein [Mesorhizobium camelthorni]